VTAASTFAILSPPARLFSIGKTDLDNIRFAEMNLVPALTEAVAACGYETPTPIQAQAIPALLAGRDVIGAAQTGTGKTAAFVLPALDLIARNGPAARRNKLVSSPRVLVLTPTRELAQQVAEHSTRYSRGVRVNIVCLYGGVPYPVQNRQLQRGADLLVATPGRLLDHIDRGRIDLSQLAMLVLDEADRMLDLGFQDDVERIVSLTPRERQTVLFSATFDGAVGRLAQAMARDPLRVDVREQRSAPTSIDQRIHFADDRAHKHRLLDHLLGDVDMRQSIVFTATKRDAEALAIRLQERGHAAAALHGDMNQRQRTHTLTALRRGGVRTLVATDVAARGIDVPGLTHVINFDLPRQAEDYLHRIGRTGRAGATGVAVSLAHHAERGTVRSIERFTGAPIATEVIPGLEPRARAPHDGDARKRSAPGKGAWGGARGGPAKPGGWGSRNGGTQARRAKR
jgi:superfamily II DNA/RNA helicase